MANDQKRSTLTSLISQQAGQTDTSTASPRELSQAELLTRASQFTDTDKQNRQNITNNAEVTRLLANRPHTALYAKNVMNVTEAEVTTEGDLHGKTFPIYVPEKARVGYDGYEIKMPEGEIKNIAKSQIKNWMIANTLGRIAGGTENKALQLVPRTSRKQGLNDVPTVAIKALGLDAANPEHYVETFTPDLGEGGAPLTRDVQVSLVQTYKVKKEGETEEKTVRARGQIKGFPIFKRKEEYLNDLGPLKQTITEATQLRLETKEAVEAAIFEIIKMANIEKGPLV